MADAGQRFVDPLGIAPGGVTGGAPGFPAERPGNGIATASMTCGIIALLLVWIPFVVVIGMVLAILAIVFGVKGLRRSSEAERGRGFAVAGLVTGIVALLASAVGIVLTVLMWNAVADFIEPGPVSTEVTQCSADGRDVEVTGELTNRSRTERDYTVFVTVGDDTEVVQLETVAPAETVDWQVDLRSRTIVDDCDPEVVVHGPFPFGVEIDAIDN